VKSWAYASHPQGINKTEWYGGRENLVAFYFLPPSPILIRDLIETELQLNLVIVKWFSFPAFYMLEARTWWKLSWNFNSVSEALWIGNLFKHCQLKKKKSTMAGCWWLTRPYL
jgi:hypothetical protein